MLWRTEEHPHFSTVCYASIECNIHRKRLLMNIKHLFLITKYLYSVGKWPFGTVYFVFALSLLTTVTIGKQSVSQEVMVDVFFNIRNN